jgi:hypothetical protein
MGVERKRMTEDWKILKDFAEAVKASQSYLGHQNYSIRGKDAPPLSAYRWITTDRL